MSAIRKCDKKHGIVFYFATFLAILLLAATVFFQSHFYPGTVINGIKVAFLNTASADQKISDAASAYALMLRERGNGKELISGAEIGLIPNVDNSSAFLKREQNKTFWAASFWKPEALEFGNAFAYDELLLTDRFETLGCMDESRVTRPQNATLRYGNGSYEVIKEINGNLVNKGLLLFYLKNAVNNGEPVLDLDEKQCYIDPKLRSVSPKVANTKAKVESYLVSKIIYQYQDGSETVDEEEISQWIEFDDELNIIFNHDKMKQFLKELAVHYNTLGKEREFITASGKKITVGGGDFGWKVDIKGEVEELAEAVVRCETIYKEPRYLQKGAARSLNDIGTTYIEIDLSRQYLWYFDEGVLVAQGAVVTGNVSSGYKTPAGIYSLKYKIKNAVLKGHNYRVGVSYWMPFNNDIGIHDASWRSQFGRDIYLTRGSHGCVNASFYLAKTLFENVSVGIPVVCYY